MNIEQTLADALSHGREMPAVATEIRDIFKSGKERLQAVRDAAKSFSDNLAAKAEASLDAFKAEVEKIEKEAEGEEASGDKKDDVPPAPVVDLSAGTTTHTAADGTVTTLDHEAGTVTAKDGDGTPLQPQPEAVNTVVQAAADAGVAVPEELKPVADPAPANQPVLG